MILVIQDAPRKELKSYYTSCAIAGMLDAQWSMPWEKGPIFLCRGRKGSLEADWKDFKYYH